MTGTCPGLCPSSSHQLRAPLPPRYQGAYPQPGLGCLTIRGPCPSWTPCPPASSRETSGPPGPVAPATTPQQGWPGGAGGREEADYFLFFLSSPRPLRLCSLGQCSLLPLTSPSRFSRQPSLMGSPGCPPLLQPHHPLPGLQVTLQGPPATHPLPPAPDHAQRLPGHAPCAHWQPKSSGCTLSRPTQTCSSSWNHSRTATVASQRCSWNCEPWSSVSRPPGALREWGAALELCPSPGRGPPRGVSPGPQAHPRHLGPASLCQAASCPL